MKTYTLSIALLICLLLPTVSYAKKSTIIGFLFEIALKEGISWLSEDNPTDSKLKNLIELTLAQLKDIENISDPTIKKQTYMNARSNLMLILSNQEVQQKYLAVAELEFMIAKLDFDFAEWNSALVHAQNVINIPYPSGFFSGIKIDPTLTQQKLRASYLMCDLGEKKKDTKLSVWCEITVAYAYSEDSKISAIETCIKNNNMEDCGHVGTNLMNRFIDQDLGSTLYDRKIRVKPNIDKIEQLITVSIDFLPQDCLKNPLKNQHEITQCYWKAVGLESLKRDKEASDIYWNICQHHTKSKDTQSYEYKSCININRPNFFEHLTAKSFEIRKIGCLLSHVQICEKLTSEYTIFNQSNQYKEIVNHITSLCFQGNPNLCEIIQNTSNSKNMLEIHSLEIFPMQANEESWDALGGLPDVEIIIIYDGLLIFYSKGNDRLHQSLNQFSIAFDINPNHHHLDILVKDLDVSEHDWIAQMKINLNELQNQQMQDFSYQYLKNLKIRLFQRQ